MNSNGRVLSKPNGASFFNPKKINNPLSGPVSSSFVNKYGCRAVTIAGAILAGVCLFASAFAQNVLTLIFTIGIGTGMGLGLIYLPAIVSVTMYFEKYRSLATGTIACISCYTKLCSAGVIIPV